ncbi:MAG: hypothetical protein AB7F89_11395 [Pirellulaceae bacterium]
MSQWRVWTSVVSGILAVGGPGTYLGWRHFASPVGEPVREVVGGGEPLQDGAQPPQPIPIPDGGAAPLFNPIPAAGPIAPASYEVVAGGGAGTVASASSHGNDHADSPPLRADFSSAAPSSAPLSAEPPGGLDDLGAPPRPQAFSASLSDGPAADMPRRRREDMSEQAGGGYGTPPLQVAQHAGHGAAVLEEVGNGAAPLPESSAGAPLDDVPEGAAPLDVAPVEETPVESDAGGDGAQPPASPLGVPAPSGLPPAALLSAPQPLSAPRILSDSSSPAQPPAALGAPTAAVGIPRSTTLPPAQDADSAPEARSGSLRNPGGNGTAGELSGSISLAPRASSTMAVGAGMTADTPGDRKFEGAQTPMLTVEKLAPEEIQIGKLAKFTVQIRNVGQVAAQGVVYADRVPRGTELVEAVPTAAPGPDGALSWELGTLQPGDETTITMDLMPQDEGEIGSVGQLSFQAQASVRTIATRPLLKVEHTGPASVLIGDDVAFHIQISNPGTGIATGVVVEVDVPEQLAHDGGREIMSDRFELRPNETRKLGLVLKAVRPGVVENLVRVVGDANLVAEHRTKLEVVAPDLEVAVSGPARRYLNRQATYQITVANPGTAPAQNIDLVAYLPQGLKFISTEKKGRYDEQKHAVLWNLEELPAGEPGSVMVSVVPIDTGEQKLHVEARAALNLAAHIDHTTIVDALTELVFTVADENDPIEVGAETTYEIRVTNHGAKDATNVRLAVELPPGLQAIRADGPTKARVEGTLIVMEPHAQLRAADELVYRLTVQGRQAGDHVLRVQVASDEFSTPVTKEESTKVYADE